MALIVFVFDDLGMARQALLGRSNAGGLHSLGMGWKWLREHAIDGIRPTIVVSDNSICDMCHRFATNYTGDEANDMVTRGQVERRELGDDYDLTWNVVYGSGPASGLGRYFSNGGRMPGSTLLNPRDQDQKAEYENQRVGDQDKVVKTQEQTDG